MWTELRDLIKSHQTTIILPIGGTEQNGPHMALGKRKRVSEPHGRGHQKSDSTTVTTI